MTPDRALPIELQMIKPIGSFNQRRPLAYGRISYANSIGSGTETDFLVQRYGGAGSTTRQPFGSVMLCCTETYALHEIRESRVRTKAVEPWINFKMNQPIGAFLISLLQPTKGLIFLSKSHVDQCYAIRRGIALS